MFLVSIPTWHDDKNVRWMCFEAWIPIDFGCSGSGTGWKCQCLTLRSAPLSMQFRCFMAASPWRTKMPNKSKKYWLVRFISQVSFMLFNVSCGIWWSFWASYQKGTAPAGSCLDRLNHRFRWRKCWSTECFGHGDMIITQLCKTQPCNVFHGKLSMWSLHGVPYFDQIDCRKLENCPLPHRWFAPTNPIDVPRGLPYSSWFYSFFLSHYFAPFWLVDLRKRGPAEDKFGMYLTMNCNAEQPAEELLWSWTVWIWLSLKICYPQWTNGLENPCPDQNGGLWGIGIPYNSIFRQTHMY